MNTPAIGAEIEDVQGLWVFLDKDPKTLDFCKRLRYSYSKEDAVPETLLSLSIEFLSREEDMFLWSDEETRTLIMRIEFEDMLEEKGITFPQQA